MRILGFDTATPATAVALWDEADGTAVSRRDDPPPGTRPNHAVQLMALIAELIDRDPNGWAGVDRIAVGVGPGTFTGLRIGVATARALGQARDLPLVGISTLESLALGARPQARLEGIETVAAVIDARRGEAFAAGFTGAEVRFEPRVLSPDALGALLAEGGKSVLAVGDGAIKFRAALERSGASIPEDDSELHRVSALNHCRLARDRPASPPDQIRPAYLRLPDAEIGRRSNLKR